MRRFHFHVRNGDGLHRDETGVDLPDAEAARAEAVEGARSIMADEVRLGRLDLTGCIEVADGAGEPVLTVSFAQAVAVRFPAWAERRAGLRREPAFPLRRRLRGA